MDDRRVTLAEGAVRFSVTASLNASPGSQPGFYNPQMALNRSMCVIELQAAVEAGAHELHGAADAGLGAADRSVRVLDCFSGSGALALRLAKEVVDGAARPVEVTAGDLNPHCADLIAQNAQLNGLGVRRVCARLEGASNAAAATADALPAPPSADGGSAGPSSAPFTVAVADARALLLLSEPYEHVHLDPFGSCAPFLDTAASCAPNGGLISLTATDTAALFANYPAVALRTYGCHLQRSDPNWREAGARALVGALATAAARHGRGIVPLHTTCAAHFVHCTVRIRRGASAADASAAEVREATTPDGARLGPLWMGPLGDVDFLKSCVRVAAAAELAASATTPTVATAEQGEEQEQEQQADSAGSLAAQGPAKAQARRQGRLELARKARRAFESSLADAPALPPFSWQIPGCASPSDLVAQLIAAGHSASRSAFDPKRVRTDAGPETRRRLGLCGART